MHVFDAWKKVGEPAENPGRYRENMPSAPVCLFVTFVCVRAFLLVFYLNILGAPWLLHLKLFFFFLLLLCQRNKRKAEVLSGSLDKKRSHWLEKAETRGAEHQAPSAEMGPEAKAAEVSQRPPGLCSGSSTRTAAVSPLGQTENATPPLQESEQVTNKLRLAQLEMEAQKLRRLLSLEATRTSRSTMTTSDLGPDQPAGLQAAAATLVKTSRAVGCQTDTAEVYSHAGFESPDDNSSRVCNPVCL